MYVCMYVCIYIYIEREFKGVIHQLITGETTMCVSYDVSGPKLKNRIILSYAHDDHNAYI